MFGFGAKTNRRWQERPQLYRGRLFYLRSVAKVTLVLGVMIGLVGSVLYFKNSDALLIRSVHALGDLQNLESRDIIALTELRPGERLFGVSLATIQKRVRRHPWVSRVSVRREFPDTIQVHVVEREPLALVQLETLYLMDQDGVLFKKHEGSDPLDLPVITGFTKKGLESFPELSRVDLHQTVQLLKYLHGAPFFKEDPLSEVHFDRVFGWTVYTLRSGLEIHYGSGGWLKKQKRLEKFKLSKQFDQRRFVRLDLSSDRKVVARTLGLNKAR